MPTYHVEVDPREHKIELLGTPHKDVQYYPASCCHPKYIEHLLSHGANVKLWHVFANDTEAQLVLPKGEWLLTGGSDVGMRAMTIARFLGYKNLHIFGLDGCEGKTGKHAGKHPNQPKGNADVVYNGKNFVTTPALLECGKQVFHELDQLSDVEFKFYGDGLIQEMAKDYERKVVRQSTIAAMNPVLISEEMREQNATLHRENAYYGVGGGKYAETVVKMKGENINSILDYGCGKGYLQKNLPFPIWQYDPAIPEYAETPRPADLVVCTDVLEHIEPDKLKDVLIDLKRCVLQIGYFVIHLGAAQKKYANGQNCHLIQKDADWWAKQLKKYFTVATAQQKGNELHLVVAPKTDVDETPILGVTGKDGIKARFYVPNETTRWRAESLVSKEPVTIEWLERMPKGAILYDVGANIGGYSIWGGVRGIEVYSFEPEAENYALLNKNIALNNLNIQAFNVAVSDKFQLNTLYLSNRGVGGACHSFAEEVDAFGNKRETPFKQGCVGISIDELVAQGLPQPDYIKIDVDGFESKVIVGAIKTLKNVKGLLIEVNPAIPEHLEMIKMLTDNGFIFDEAQVKASTRQEGNFKGVAEYVFYRTNETEKQILTAIDNAKIIQKPFPHLVIDEIYLPELTETEYLPLEKVRGTLGYPERFVAQEIDAKYSEIFASGKIKEALCRKFGVKNQDLREELLLIRDKEGYQIAPHTDIPDKVITSLFYLPQRELKGAGTNFYAPKKKGFTCSKGKHYEFNEFRKVKEVAFVPNRVLIFARTDTSFHGVEPSKNVRDVLLYEIRK